MSLGVPDVLQGEATIFMLYRFLKDASVQVDNKELWRVSGPDSGCDGWEPNAGALLQEANVLNISAAVISDHLGAARGSLPGECWKSENRCGTLHLTNYVATKSDPHLQSTRECCLLHEQFISECSAASAVVG